ncbi:MAG: hypothetical protein DWQ09_02605 [Proteobacteria bacterium]|nr:MAG: hypothetical protein DWQ09_02605 [Pseudomonadota bacterium]QKK10916.1 MAG: hypothetical protein HND59_04190 [Pseudomonadota bacterium]
MSTADHPTWRLLDRLGRAGTDALFDPRQDSSEKEGAYLCCRACSHRVTELEARTRRAGHHRHRFINPQGHLFEIGCFGDAVDSRLYGPAIGEHSWFAGYAWRIALCAGCGVHLGWRYEGTGTPFYGLILAQLVECREGRRH